MDRHYVSVWQYRQISGLTLSLNSKFYELIKNCRFQIAHNVVIYQREFMAFPLKIKALMVRFSKYSFRVAKLSLFKYSYPDSPADSG